MIHPKIDEDKREQHRLDVALIKGEGRSLVYIDESGFAVDGGREYGYAERGRRCLGKKNWGAKGRVNAIGALLAHTFTLLAVTLFSGTVNSDVFYQWVICDLLPVVPFNAVIVMDNASFHKRKDIEKAIIDAGFDLLFLPTYSPDLNPIEHKWAQAKAIRKAERCDTETLFTKHVA